MAKVKCVNDEYKRLKKLFNEVNPEKTELVDELLQKAAFLKVELDYLEEQIKKYGSIQISSKGNQRVSVSFKTYLSSINTYQTIIRTLNSIMGKNIIDEEDDFDDFLKAAVGK